MTAPAPPGAGPLQSAMPGATNRGLCTLTYAGRIFRFRTNPNEIWWSYELISNVEETYGGRVVQLLGTRLGDLTLKVECGQGGWNYLMQVVLFLRDLLNDQRKGNPALFEYTTRNWQLKVYSMSIPFQDEVTATTREIALSFKIQEDVTGVLSQITLDANIARLKAGVYGPGWNPHNQFDDPNAMGQPGGLTTPENPSGPSYTAPNITNTVDSTPQGNNPGGVNLFSLVPFASSIPGVGNLNISAFGGL